MPDGEEVFLSHPVWLNIDAGESPDESEELYRVADVVNIACGGHAGDPASMRRVLALCAQFGTGVGAHPSYADRENFGRRAQSLDDDALCAHVREQCAALSRHAAEFGLRVTHVKAHGALYHAAANNQAIANTVARGAALGLCAGSGEVTVIGPAFGPELANAAKRESLRFAREGYADRGVNDDGTLIARGLPGALVTDPELAAARARALVAAGGIETICVHGDTQNALEIARAVKAILREAEGVRSGGASL